VQRCNTVQRMIMLRGFARKLHGCMGNEEIVISEENISSIA